MTTELPEDVARELEELYGAADVPDNAVSLLQLTEWKGGSTTMWAKRMKAQIALGTWARGKRTGDQAYWYWPVDG